MSAPHGRRGFLRGLVSLPLIGGGVTLAATMPALRPLPPTLRKHACGPSIIALGSMTRPHESHGTTKGSMRNVTGRMP